MIILLLGVFSQFGCSNFQNNPKLKISENSTEKIDEVINTLYENGQFSGVVLVSVKGDIMYKKAVGYANIEDSILHTVDTKFRIASFTKPFTAMLILQLVEDGKIKLDGKLVDYLPEFKVARRDEITFHQLLTHTAGITGHPRISNLIEIEQQYYQENIFLSLLCNMTLFMNRAKEMSTVTLDTDFLSCLLKKLQANHTMK